jgi:hypothetical protein
MSVSNAAIIRRRATTYMVVAFVVIEEHEEILLPNLYVRDDGFRSTGDRPERARQQATCSLCPSKRVREGMVICGECANAASKRHRAQRANAERG